MVDVPQNQTKPNFKGSCIFLKNIKEPIVKKVWRQLIYIKSCDLYLFICLSIISLLAA